MRKVVLGVWVVVMLVCPPAAASAFCGFYVSGASADLYNDATMVSLMRKGQTTVMAMRNDYQGPPEDFAMVVPVPQVLEKNQVKTLEDGVFDRLRGHTRPRLVKYKQQDPCGGESTGWGWLWGGAGDKRYKAAAVPGEKERASTVEVESRFTAGEYNIVVLDSEESNSLERWLRRRDYNIPEGAAKYLRPYVQRGSYFFVAKVDVSKVTFHDGRAVLSPLRFHYESESFRLPVRLGLINAKGQQDLLIHIFGAGTRYDVVNRPNVAIPTNLPVSEAVAGQFDAFYDALFSRIMTSNPSAVVTEYAFGSTKCDPCPPNTVSRSDFRVLGGDVIVGGQDGSGLYLRYDGNPVQRVEVEGEFPDGEMTPGRALPRVGTNKTRIAKCVASRLESSDEQVLGATMRVLFDKSGDAEAVEVEDGALDDESVECLAGLVEGMRLPDRMNGSVSEVRFHLSLDASKLERQLGRGAMQGWVVTRLHTRYDADELGEDLVFGRAPPIQGGNGMPEGKRGAMDSTGPSAAERNRFQARYVLRDSWEGEMDCYFPDWNRWSGGSMSSGSPDMLPAPEQGAESEARGGTDEKLTLSEGIDWRAMPLESVGQLSEFETWEPGQMLVTPSAGGGLAGGSNGWGRVRWLALILLAGGGCVIWWRSRR